MQQIPNEELPNNRSDCGLLRQTFRQAAGFSTARKLAQPCELLKRDFANAAE
jgi:hypothetical protein